MTAETGPTNHHYSLGRNFTFSNPFGVCYMIIVGTVYVGMIIPDVPTFFPRDAAAGIDLKTDRYSASDSSGQPGMEHDKTIRFSIFSEVLTFPLSRKI